MNIIKMYVQVIKDELLSVLIMVQHLALAVGQYGYEVIVADPDKAMPAVMELTLKNALAVEEVRAAFLKRVVFTTAMDVFVRDGGSYDLILQTVRLAAIAAIAKDSFSGDLMAEYDLQITQPLGKITDMFEALSVGSDDIEEDQYPALVAGIAGEMVSKFKSVK